jgi:16S rRNA processing protein RimM
VDEQVSPAPGQAGALPSADSTLVIGRILTTSGLAGVLKVQPLTDCPERFLGLTEVLLELPGGESRPARIESSRLRGRGLLLTFEGFRSSEEASRLRGALIRIPASEAVRLPEGHYFLHQVIGLRVVTPEGEDLGEVTEILHSPAHDIYVTGKTMIPALRRFVKAINLEAGEMVVDLPPALRVELPG